MFIRVVCWVRCSAAPVRSLGKVVDASSAVERGLRKNRCPRPPYCRMDSCFTPPFGYLTYRAPAGLPDALSMLVAIVKNSSNDVICDDVYHSEAEKLSRKRWIAPSNKVIYLGSTLP